MSGTAVLFGSRSGRTLGQDTAERKTFSSAPRPAQQPASLPSITTAGTQSTLGACRIPRSRCKLRGWLRPQSWNGPWWCAAIEGSSISLLHGTLLRVWSRSPRGALAGNISLVGFGIDSFVEVTSGAALLWRMSADADLERRERNERRALRTVGTCFLVLAAHITYESTMDLWSKNAPQRSIPGIVLACASLVVMPLLSRAKRRVARALSSAAVHADAKQTEFYTYLSGILLGELLLNAVFGFWWADPVAGLVMVPIIGKEGIDGLQGKACDVCCSP